MELNYLNLFYHSKGTVQSETKLTKTYTMFKQSIHKTDTEPNQKQHRTETKSTQNKNKINTTHFKTCFFKKQKQFKAGQEKKFSFFFKD